ncbi:acetyltransferase [Paracoccus siganidrum]|uniref:Acetyltransferase n=1 Tax=Paracoccus siganidrum TaxID=1276757 RepID=A0A418ZUS1_9RHOB|nr:acetyltransferase [Paracoccus siganidrum]RJL03310.1 acetyltransferase [Paracoccus siganidrum]RMC30547.1 acetyltransferase [Paracoccus siganidrum]
MKSTTEFDEITVFGARGHSLMILRNMEEYWRGRVRIRALIDDIENGFSHPGLGVPVISSATRLRDYADLPVLLTVTSTSLRKRVAAQLADEGATLATAICPERPLVDPVVDYGAGCVCLPTTRIGPDVRIGAGTIVLSSLIAHDVEIGDFSTLAGESFVSGHVKIGAQVNIAPRAVISNGRRTRPLRIGDGAEIGTGAVVVRDVASGERLIGNPAMPIRNWVKLQRLLSSSQGG